METIENYKCSKCYQTCTVSKRQFFVSNPKILLVYIKRFNFFGTTPQKLNTKIKASEFLRLETSNLINDTGDYDLNSFVNHRGQINSGHYIATIHKNDNWLTISDDKGSIDSIEELSNKGSSEVYLMAYVKRVKRS